jgi:hypothetical protein
MIRFFRKIRQKLLVKNQLQKYMLYAIGEIFLVMIGILLALGVNNWNETRKADKVEVKLLTELKEAIISDYLQIEMVIQLNQSAQSSCKILLEHLNENFPYNDSLLMHFRESNNWAKLMLVKGPYNNAKSYGLNFIKNDSTRNLLSKVYEYQMVWSNTLDKRQTQYYYQTVIPEMTELFEFTSAPYLYNKGVAPNNYESLLYNQRYLNILKSNIENRKQEIDWANFIYNNMKDLEARIQSEIEMK